MSVRWRQVTTERRILLIAIAAWLAVAVIALVASPPLGHDEAAFAAAARGDAPAWLYRSQGVVALARIGIWLGGSDFALRIVPTLLGVGVVIGTFAVGRAAFGSRTGAWAAAVIAGAHPMLMHGAELIGDLPATACVLAGIAILIGELDRVGGPRWRLVGAAPAFAAAFYFRYGSAPVIALAGIAAVGVWWRPLVARPARALATVGAFAALLAPHVIHSLSATGSMLGILSVSAAMPHRDYIGEGLITYVTAVPFAFYGALVSPAMIAGLVAIARPPERRRPTAFLAIVALGQIILLGLESHAQPRYVFVASALLVVLGVDALLRYLPQSSRQLGPGLVALAWLGMAIAVVPIARYVTQQRAPLWHAAGAVTSDAAGRSCVVAARDAPELIWATHCKIVRATPPYQPLPADRLRYVVSVPRLTVDVAPIAEVEHAAARALFAADGAAVWRLDPAERSATR